MGNFLDGKLISLKVNIADDFMPFETVVAKFIEKDCRLQPVSTEVFETVLSKADIRAYPARIWQNRNKILIVYKYPQTTVIFLEDMTDLLPEIQQNQSKKAKSILDKKLDIEKTKF